MKFCSDCGSLVERQTLAHDSRERLVCGSCGAVHYQNPLVIVNCIVVWDGRILLCQRADDPYKGKWSIPSGYLERGETLEQGAARETREETGVLVDPRSLELYALINMTAIDQVAVTFRTALNAEPMIECGPECTRVRFMSPMELAADDYAWHESIGDLRHRLGEEVRTGQYCVSLMSLGSSCGEGIRSRNYQISGISEERGYSWH